MADPDDIDDEAAANALRPKETAAGSHKVVEHSLRDQIALSQYLRSHSVPTDTSFCGIGIVPTIPPAAG